MNTFELEKVLKTFKPPEWDTRVFARNLRSSTGKCVFICNTDCSHNEGTHWVALSINDQGEGLYFDSYGLPPVFKEFSTFLKVILALTMMFNCKDLSGLLTLLCIVCPIHLCWIKHGDYYQQDGEIQ